MQYKRLKSGMENKMYFANIDSCIFVFFEKKKDRTVYSITIFCTFLNSSKYIQK